MNTPCSTCRHPLRYHVRSTRDLGCPPDQFRFTFQVGDTQVYETVASVGLARPIARELVKNHGGATIRIFKHNPRIPYTWER